MAELVDARKILSETFGFPDFRPGQERVIEALLAGRSALAVFPTGGGKSLCYQVPALLLDGLTVVVSPLIALMKDQIDFLTKRGVPAARLDSTLEAGDVQRVFESLREDRLRLLYVAPERLASERFLHTLSRRRIALLAIDEAHCISEWGHNFRPEYLKLARLAARLQVGRVLALTATATPDVARDVARSFSIEPDDVVITGFHRPNLEVYATPCSASERYQKLLHRLQTQGSGPAIVYVTLQRTAEDLAQFLTKNGLDARVYHAGLVDDRRHAVQDWFMSGSSGVVVATIAFGMGIDKADIRAVYHHNLPKSLENYAQEIGRAGRDGLRSRCELFACAEDVVTLENFTFGDTPTAEAIGDFLEEILGLGQVFDVSVYELSQTHDIRSLVVQTVLTYLELEGVIEATGPFYAAYKFQPVRSSKEILARFDESRASLLRRVFQQAKKGRTWFSLDVDKAARELGEPRDRIVKALNYLEEQGDLILQTSEIRQGYRLANASADHARLQDVLSARFLERERRDVARVRRVLEFSQEAGCLTRRLLDYFGETLPSDCGHCGPCLGQAPAPLPRAAVRPLGDAERNMLAVIRAEGHKALGLPRQLTRFLCGLPSPAASRDKLARHPWFGALADVPFERVLALAEGRA